MPTKESTLFIVFSLLTIWFFLNGDRLAQASIELMFLKLTLVFAPR
jgi:hypothetical protein